jgi:hypothetical protein
MTNWRLAIGTVLILHGIGHVLGLIALTSLGSDSWNARSWLLGDSTARIVSAELWAVLLIAFVVAGLALLELGFPESWWKPVAVVAAAGSLVALALFWNAFPVLFPNKIGAMAVNTVVLVGILITDWPTEEMLTA